jgi:DNA-binding winged helix-turn-helix (wHTH) protein
MQGVASMDHSVHKVVRFDQFVLDFTRGCLRMGQQEIDLPPKAFQVLSYLALNAGRLVSKEELLDAVWAGVVVTDESLVQSIRQLRQKLGDRGHRLIKTVPRRGYRLEATLDTEPSQSVAPEPGAAAIEQLRGIGAGFGAPLINVDAKRHLWVAASGLLCVLVAVAYLLALIPGPFAHTGLMAPPSAARLFTTDDATRVAAIAVTKQLPLPAFQIREPARDVPNGIRRFVGIWVSDTGWMGSNRQLMLIVTQVDRDGTAIGYGVSGPPQPMGHVQNPAGPFAIKARISAGSLSWKGNHGQHVASLTEDNRVELRLTYWDDTIGVVSLDPVWTLVEAERAAAVSATAR